MWVLANVYANDLPEISVGEPVDILFRAGEERAALRLFLRALREIAI